MDSITRVFEYRPDNSYKFRVDKEYESCEIALQRISIKKDIFVERKPTTLSCRITIPDTYSASSTAAVYTRETASPVIIDIPITYSQNFQDMVYMSNTAHDSKSILTYRNSVNSRFVRFAIKIFTHIENDFLVVNVQGVHTSFTAQFIDYDTIFNNEINNSTLYATAIKEFSFLQRNSVVGLTFGEPYETPYNMKWTRCLFTLPSAIASIPSFTLITDLPLVSKTYIGSSEYVAFDTLFNNSNNRILVYEPENLLYKKCSKFANFTIGLTDNSATNRIEKHSTISITLSIIQPKLASIV